MNKERKFVLSSLLILMLASFMLLTACSSVGSSDSDNAPEVVDDTPDLSPSGSSQANSSVPVSRGSSSFSPNSTTASSSLTLSAASSESQESTERQTIQSTAPSSSEDQTSSHQPAATSEISSSATSAPTPQSPPPKPAQTYPAVDIESVIAQGHAYAAERNMTVNPNSPSCLGPIETTDCPQDSVIGLLLAQFDVIYAAMIEIPEYEPGMVVPCYNLVVADTVIYLYFG